jgi:hypothetical protein
MRYAHSLAILLAVVISGCTTDEDRMMARVEALPELPAAIADQLDETTMALRNPELGTLPQPEVITNPQLKPCCSIKITKRLKVRYETTWCVNPFKDLVLSANLEKKAPGDVGGVNDVRHSKLTNLRGKQLLRPFWCQTSSGPWDADLVFDHGCTSGPYYSLVVSTPGGLVSFPPWVGGEGNKPASVTVLECTLVSTARSTCGISTCDCRSSSCSPPEQCSCPVF